MLEDDLVPELNLKELVVKKGQFFQKTTLKCMKHKSDTIRFEKKNEIYCLFCKWYKHKLDRMKTHASITCQKSGGSSAWKTPRRPLCVEMERFSITLNHIEVRIVVCGESLLRMRKKSRAAKGGLEEQRHLGCSSYAPSSPELMRCRLGFLSKLRKENFLHK